MGRVRTAVLISGRGSNLQALIDAAADPAYPADPALVVSNVAGAAGLARAEQAGIATCVLPHRDFPSRAAFDAALHELLESYGISLVCLAGFMRLLGPRIVADWEGRMLNIHPSLLPAFKGLDVHRQVLDAGVRVSGCSVHFVTADLDAGPVIVQGVVPVLPDDDEERLAARVLTVEHRCYPAALGWLASGRVRLENGCVRYGDVPAPEAWLSNPQV